MAPGLIPRLSARVAVAPVQRHFSRRISRMLSHGQSFRRHHPLRRTGFDQNGDGKRRPAALPGALGRASQVTHEAVRIGLSRPVERVMHDAVE